MNLIKVFIGGRLTKDPEITTTTTGKTVARLSIAVQKYTKPGEDKQADFFNCVAFEKTAEYLQKYAVKGVEIMGIGRLQNRSWEKDGKKQYATDIIIDEVPHLEFKKQGRTEQTEQQSDDGFMTVQEDQLPF